MKDIKNYLPAGNCFVVWGGDAESQVFWLSDNMYGKGDERFCSVFMKYVQDYQKVFETISLGEPNEIYEDEWARAFRPVWRGLIDLELVEEL